MKALNSTIGPQVFCTQHGASSFAASRQVARSLLHFLNILHLSKTIKAVSTWASVVSLFMLLIYPFLQFRPLSNLLLLLSYPPILPSSPPTITSLLLLTITPSFLPFPPQRAQWSGQGSVINREWFLHINLFRLYFGCCSPGHHQHHIHKNITNAPIWILYPQYHHQPMHTKNETSAPTPPHPHHYQHIHTNKSTSTSAPLHPHLQHQHIHTDTTTTSSTPTRMTSSSAWGAGRMN